MSDDYTPPEEEQGGLPAWMATFSDMVTLLLTFFVLLLSFSTMDVKKLQQVLGSVQEALGVKSVEVGSYRATEQLPAAMVSLQKDREEVQKRVFMRQIYNAIKETNLEEEAKIINDERGVMVRVDGTTMFESGKADFKPAAIALMDKIIKVMERFNYDIMVEGHSDNVPISGRGVYQSNWELSAARAARVADYLVDKGIAKTRMSVLGRADTRPITSNATEEGRAMNRRVEFIFVKEESKKNE